MRIVTVGEIRKNFREFVNEIQAGEEIIITRYGQPVARLVGLGPKAGINWPDFGEEAVSLRGKLVGDLVIEDREDRF